MLFFTVVGMVTCGLVGLAFAGLVFIAASELALAWWQVVRIRAVMHRYGRRHPASLRQWASSIWKLAAGDYRAEYEGVVVPQSPFKPLGHNHRR